MNFVKLIGTVQDRVLYSYHVLKLAPKYVMACINQKGTDIPQIQFYSDEETISMIVNNGMSLCRFGDGEFKWMGGCNLNSFQDYSQSLKDDLITSILNNNPKLIIGIPKGVFNSNGCRLYARMWWTVIRNDTWNYMKSFVKTNKIYANASITRPYIDYLDTEFAKKTFANMKRIWDKKDICILEGEETKLGLGNDLFDNASSIVRVIAPSKNAYSKKNDIKDAIRSKISKSTIIISALGPTASILASELCDEGYQFVDVGHVDIEYMWYLNKYFIRKKIPGKYTNECGGSSFAQLYEEDNKYQSSIIARIKL